MTKILDLASSKSQLANCDFDDAKSKILVIFYHLVAAAAELGHGAMP